MSRATLTSVFIVSGFSVVASSAQASLTLKARLVATATAGTGGGRALEEVAAIIFAATIDFSHGCPPLIVLFDCD